MVSVFRLILGQYWQVWYKKAGTQAGKLNGDLKTIIRTEPKQNKKYSQNHAFRQIIDQ